jgi:hypothetical protein
VEIVGVSGGVARVQALVDSSNGNVKSPVARQKCDDPITTTSFSRSQQGVPARSGTQDMPAHVYSLQTHR